MPSSISKATRVSAKAHLWRWLPWDYSAAGKSSRHRQNVGGALFASIAIPRLPSDVVCI
jgi:hypothetical protein